MTQALTTDRLREIAERRSPSLRWGEAEKIAAELLANREAQPVEYQSRTKPNWDKKHPWSNWERCSEGTYNDLIKANLEICDWIYEVRRLFTAPPAPAVNILRRGLTAQSLVSAWLIFIPSMNYSSTHGTPAAPAMLAQPVSQGCKLVRVEPTPKQWAAGVKVMDTGMDKVTLVYKAMLAAAPEGGNEK